LQVRREMEGEEEEGGSEGRMKEGEERGRWGRERRV
jgi:hypothetical protein